MKRRTSDTITIYCGLFRPQLAVIYERACRICEVQIQPRKQVLDLADYTNPTRQHQLDHTDYIDHLPYKMNVDHAWSGNRRSVRRVSRQTDRPGSLTLRPLFDQMLENHSVYKTDRTVTLTLTQAYSINHWAVLFIALCLHSSVCQRYSRIRGKLYWTDIPGRQKKENGRRKSEVPFQIIPQLVVVVDSWWRWGIHYRYTTTTIKYQVPYNGTILYSGITYTRTRML